MASTQALIVYATVSQIVRRVVVPDSDGEISNPQLFCGPGEGAVVVAQQALIDGPSVNSVLANALSVSLQAIPTGRCAVVDGTGTVAAIIMADPLLDSIPQRTLVATDTAGIGWTYLAGIFTAPVSV